MEQRYFNNPYDDYKGQPVEVDENYVRNLIKSYVKQIVENTRSGDSRGDLYVGDAGAISTMNTKSINMIFIQIHFFAIIRHCVYVPSAMPNK